MLVKEVEGLGAGRQGGGGARPGDAQRSDPYRIGDGLGDVEALDEAGEEGAVERVAGAGGVDGVDSGGGEGGFALIGSPVGPPSTESDDHVLGALAEEFAGGLSALDFVDGVDRGEGADFGFVRGDDLGGGDKTRVAAPGGGGVKEEPSPQRGGEESIVGDL